ncbi:MAG: twin-arginine translocation pathway signal protein [Burkholderiaceae bacterium]
MSRRNFIQLAGGGIILAATSAVTGCSSTLPREATAPWRTAGSDEADVRRWMLGWALLAPKAHTLQSWVVDLRTANEITLYCDRDRLLPQTDPYSRQILLSHGTFLEVLDMAARERGLRARIELFPEGTFAPTTVDGRPVARVRLQPDPTVNRDPLFAQVVHRRTNRETYDPRVPAASALQVIQSAVGAGSDPATVAGALTVGFATADQTDRIAEHRRIAREAWRIEMTTPATIMESLKVLRIGPDEINRHRDGIAINTPMVRALVAVGLFDRSKAPAPGDSSIQRQIDDFNDKIDATPAFFWLVSRGNDRATQVNAGRAYVRAQLAATEAGLGMHPLSQALQEYPQVAQPYAQIHALLGARPGLQTVQMWTRLGHAPAIDPSPRRGIAALVRQA